MNHPAFEEIKSNNEFKDRKEKQLNELQKISDGEYRISPGDVFDLYVFDNPDYDAKGIIVMPDGTISVYPVGVIEIRGKTIEETIKAIEAQLGKYMKMPSVTLVPVQMKNPRVTVIGAVNSPGVYVIKKGFRITDAVAEAKGFLQGRKNGQSTELANLQMAFISRQNKVLPVDFLELFRNGNARENIPLKDGDYIFFPSTMASNVFVLGEVVSPGYCPYDENLTISRALSFAKGRKDISSDLAVVVRGKLINPTVYKINIEDILRGRAPDFPLLPDDIVYFPSGPIADYNLFIEKILPTFELWYMAATPFIRTK